MPQKKNAAVRASYRRGVAWIALNDEPTETDGETVAGQISVLLLADLFEKEAEVVAAAILRYRRSHAED